MSAVVPTRTDLTIQAAVQAELEWTPEADASRITVNVLRSVVTLSGSVDDYVELNAVKTAARRVRGVSTLVTDVLVQSVSGDAVTEADLERESQHALAWKIDVPSTVRATVDGHSVTLEGEVGWNFQRVAATRAIQYLPGIYSVDNRITLSARASAAAAEERVMKALVRNAWLDAQRVKVKIVGNKATLTGSVHTLMQKRQAGIATWSSPHVTEVDNRLEVHPA